VLDLGRPCLVPQGPQQGDGLRRGDRQVEAGLGRVRVEQRLARVGVSQFEQGGEVVAVNRPLKAKLGREVADPPPRRFAWSHVVVLRAVDDFSLVVVSTSQLADRDHADAHLRCIGVGNDGQYGDNFRMGASPVS